MFWFWLYWMSLMILLIFCIFLDQFSLIIYVFSDLCVFVMLDIVCIWKLWTYLVLSIDLYFSLFSFTFLWNFILNSSFFFMFTWFFILFMSLIIQTFPPFCNVTQFLICFNFIFPIYIHKKVFLMKIRQQYLHVIIIDEFYIIMFSNEIFWNFQFLYFLFEWIFWTVINLTEFLSIMWGE